MLSILQERRVRQQCVQPYRTSTSLSYTLAVGQLAHSEFKLHADLSAARQRMRTLKLDREPFSHIREARVRKSSYFAIGQSDSNPRTCLALATGVRVVAVLLIYSQHIGLPSKRPDGQPNHT